MRIDFARFMNASPMLLLHPRCRGPLIISCQHERAHGADAPGFPAADLRRSWVLRKRFETERVTLPSQSELAFGGRPVGFFGYTPASNHCQLHRVNVP